MSRRVIARVQSGTVVREPDSIDPVLDPERMRSIIEGRRAPIMGTSERMYLEGRTSRHGFDTDAEAERCCAMARQAGISVHGKVYHSQIARKGLGVRDPLAWVSGVEDLAEACRRTGKGCEALGITGRDPVSRPAPRLAEDLIEELLERMAEEDEAIPKDPRRRAEARAQIIERHGQKVGKVVGNTTVGDQR